MIFDFIANILSPVTKLIDEVDTSDEERLKLRNQLARIERDVKLKALELDKEIFDGQTKIQLAELKQESNFVKMARPFATWSLVSIILFNYVGSPVLRFLYGIDFPPINDTAIITLGAISGTHTLGRSLEKIKGKHK